ncbi:MAG: DUF1326 domain-containing protein [Planctomycetes bacterium]|nr:DUF1326 domain-containing protein [Planctomycetota bacterium]
MLRHLVSLSIGIGVAAGVAAVLHFHGHCPLSQRANARFAPAAGEYVEARTASLFAGACHYNGELVTAGREALLAWHFDSGVADGLELSGLDAVAVVRADDNLKLAGERSSIVYVPSNLDEHERESLRAVLERHAQGALGEVREIRGADLKVDVEGEHYSVRVDGVAELDGSLDADRACCSMPQNVWYEPLAKLDERVVGKSETFAFHDASFGSPWTRHDANDTFVGKFSGVSICCEPAAKSCCTPPSRGDIAP